MLIKRTMTVQLLFGSPLKYDFYCFVFVKCGLTFSSQEGHLSIVQFLIMKGTDVNRADNEGWTPLLIASQVYFLFVLLFKIVFFNLQCNNAPV